MINFGLPYQGSKSKVAAELIRLLPPGNRFVDVFAGGCAMTHAALLSGRWQSYLANDVVALPQLFKDAIDGKYNNETRWISREDFFALKDSDPYVKICWSFGNNGRDYMYSREIEPWKHALHALLVWKDPALMREFGIITSGSRQDIIKHHAEYKEKYVRWYLQNVWKSSEEYNKMVTDSQGKIKRNIEKSLQRLQSLESLQRLQRLQSLERLQRLESRIGDYRGIEIKPGDVVYCDPPYKGTANYNNSDFDHEAFYDWVESLNVPVYISEYSMPDDRFLCVKTIKTTSRLSNKGTDGVVYEKLFVKRPKK